MHELKSAMNSYKKKALLTAVLQMTLIQYLCFFLFFANVARLMKMFRLFGTILFP